MFVVPKHQVGSLLVAVGIKTRNYRKTRTFTSISCVPVDNEYNSTYELPWFYYDNREKNQDHVGNKLEDWYSSLKVKRPIIPMVYDWGTCSIILNDILGVDTTGTPVFEKIFNYNKRIDLCSIYYFLNDMAHFYGEDSVFYREASEKDISISLKVKRHNQKNPYAKSIDLINFYKAIQKNFQIILPKKHQIV